MVLYLNEVCIKFRIVLVRYPELTIIITLGFFHITTKPLPIRSDTSHSVSLVRILVTWSFINSNHAYVKMKEEIIFMFKTYYFIT